MTNKETEIVFENDLASMIEEIYQKIGKRPSKIVKDSTGMKIYFGVELNETQISKVEESVASVQPLMKKVRSKITTKHHHC